jgi:hypothetical protein
VSDFQFVRCIYNIMQESHLCGFPVAWNYQY